MKRILNSILIFSIIFSLSACEKTEQKCHYPKIWMFLKEKVWKLWRQLETIICLMGVRQIQKIRIGYRTAQILILIQKR